MENPTKQALETAIVQIMLQSHHLGQDVQVPHRIGVLLEMFTAHYPDKLEVHHSVSVIRRNITP